MSDHNKPQSPELFAMLVNHGLSPDKPSQLSDSFRHGWNARADTHQAAIDAAVLDERERCAAVCDARARDYTSMADKYRGGTDPRMRWLSHAYAVEAAAADIREKQTTGPDRGPTP